MSTSNYEDFLQSKAIHAESVGIDDCVLPEKLYPFQRDITKWALSRGRAAMFCDCGLGKTPMQLSWASNVPGNVLILAPLAVSKQTAREGEKFGILVNICRTQADVKPGINIANYEMLHHFDPAEFTGIVLDESSILKNFSGVYRGELTDFARNIPYRLACTATPAPNDLIEIINHADFLGIMSGKEVIALFFTQDGNTTHSWRLKGHAKKDFWTWMATWCVAVRKPSDLGHDDGPFILPDKRIHYHELTVDVVQDGFLFPVEAQTLDERRKARKSTIDDRIAAVAGIVARHPKDQWLIWCDLNEESEKLKKAIPGSVEVKGADTSVHKEWAMMGFASGEVQIMISKPSICGHGMNYQSSHRMIFAGLSDSFEQFYQAIRRQWRFGQKRPVDIHVVTSEMERAVVRNIQRKEMESGMIMDNIVAHMSGVQCGKAEKSEMTYREDEQSGENWRMLLGDCIDRIDEIDTESVGHIVFSPPFPGMYVYTNSERDMGNNQTIQALIDHYSFLAPKLLRIIKPGRSCCVHLTQAVAFKGVDGYIGIKDFRGRVIETMEAAGWIYYGECTIDKNPQVKAIRTRDSGLQFKSLATDSARMHMALADYLLQFRKPGENFEVIKAGISEKYKNPGGWITQEEWILWARPVWYGDDMHPGLGIRETDVLNVALARDTNDERHLCPLQLGVIERSVKLWSNPGDVVFSPFGGVGSEGYKSVQLGRKFIGIELKESYWKSACNNLRQAEHSSITGTLF